MPNEIRDYKVGLLMQRECDKQSRKHRKGNRFNMDMSSTTHIPKHMLMSDRHTIDRKIDEVIAENDTMPRE